MTRGWPWRKLGLLALPGLVIGLGSVTGWFPAWSEAILWTIVGVAWAWAAWAWKLPRPILMLGAVGLTAGVLTGGVHGLLAHVLAETNAGYAADLGDPVTVGDRLELFGGAVGIGLVWGLLFGTIAWGIGRWRGARGQPGHSNA